VTSFKREPLTKREALLMLEGLYNIIGELEMLDRKRPAPDEMEAMEYWYAYFISW
jgi:hypothetical protein